MDVRDNEKHQIGSTGTEVANLAYRSRIPNIPYRFADYDVTLSWPGLGGRGNTLALTYDAQYLHSFSYYSEAIAAATRTSWCPGSSATTSR